VFFQRHVIEDKTYHLGELNSLNYEITVDTRGF